MHVIRNKATREVLFIDHFSSGQPIAGEEVYPGFDAATMEVGWTRKTYIPVHFDIDEKGEVVEISLERQVAEGLLKLSPSQKLVEGKIPPKSLDELLAEGIIELGMLKNNNIEAFSRLSFELRQKLIPDYQLHNATLGIYDEDKRAAYQATVAAFRDEFYRLKSAVEQAANLAALQAITPNFPSQIAGKI